VARVVLYGKPGCHLCEDARAVVLAAAARRDLELEEVDISIDPELHRRYGERIPVVTLDGEEAFEYFVDPDALDERLDRVDS
jgi:glutaredoxin